VPTGKVQQSGTDVTAGVSATEVRSNINESRSGAIANESRPTELVSENAPPKKPVKQAPVYTFEKFPWQSIGSFNEGKKFDRSLMSDSEQIRTFVVEMFQGDLYWNTSLIIGVCFFSWLMSRWRFGIFGLMFVFLSASSVYRAEYRRFERNVRDDIQRVNAAERLEQNFESMNWLNNLLAKFWVIYMPALSETVLAIANEILKDMAPGFGIDALSLDQFTLGTKAPGIDSIKSYTKKGRDTIEWDWAFRFTPDDTSDMTKNEIERKVDPKVALGVRVGKAMISKKLPILVEKMSIRGRAKITLKFSLNFPHVKMVSISLLEPPKIDFSLKPVGGETFGLDVMSLIPGLSSLITTLINSNVGPILYAPNHLDIDVEELMAGQGRDTIGVIGITVKGANKLRDTINPYVQLFTDREPEKFVRTEIKAKVKDVRWNETKYILVSSLQQKLHLDVYNFSTEKKKGELFGSHEVELESLLQSDAQLGLSKPIEMAGKKKGFVNYDIRWFPVLRSEKSSTEDEGDVVDAPDSEVAVFKLIIHQVKNLDASATITGSLNPRAELYVDGELVKKYRTLKHSNEPSWEETTEFLVTQKSAASLSLIIKDTGSREGEVIDCLQEDLETLAFNVSEGSDIFTMKNGGEIRLTAIWKPLSLSSASGGAGYIPPLGVARLHIRYARDLLNLEAVGEVDPYCRVLLNKRLKFQTTFHSGTCNPDFDEVIYLPITAASQTISLELMDEQKVTKNRPLGKTNIKISDFTETDDNNNLLFKDGTNKVLSAQLRLDKKKPKGTVFYSLSFIPSIPVYSVRELEELDEREAAMVLRRKERAEEAEEWEELYKSSPDDYEWIDIEDKDEAEIERKEKMTLDQLLTYRSGTLGIHIIEGKVKKNESYIQVLVDDLGSPSLISAKASARVVDSEIGDVFIRDLPNSTITFRNTKKKQVKEAEQVIEETTLKTIDVLQKGYAVPYSISFGGISLKVQFEYIPSAIKLPPSETILDTGKAQIEFLDGENLQAADLNGKSDPFIMVKLGDIELFKSKVVRKTLSPTWNEGTTLPIISRSRSNAMLYVYDWDRTGKNELIGECKLDLSQLKAFSSELITFKLQPQGSIRARVTFAPEYMRPKVGAKEFGLSISYLTGAPLKGVGAAANLATGVAGAGAGIVTSSVGTGAGIVSGGVGAGAQVVTGGVGGVAKGGSSLIKSVLGGKKSKKSLNGNSRRPSIDGSVVGSIQGDAGSITSRSTQNGGTLATTERQHQRTGSQISTFTQAARGKKSTEGKLLIRSGTNLGKEAKLRVSLAIDGKLKEIFSTKAAKISNGVIRWDEETMFDAPKEAEVVFGGVVHHTFSKDTEIGTASIKLSEVVDRPRDITLELGQGEIVVSFRYSPELDSRHETPPPPGW
jgi:Ca2+-dependent lipid-binding protein